MKEISKSAPTSRSRLILYPSGPGNPEESVGLCPSTGEKTLCHLRFRRRGCARCPRQWARPRHIMFIRPEEATPPSQVCRFAIGIVTASRKRSVPYNFQAEQWPGLCVLEIEQRISARPPSTCRHRDLIAGKCSRDYLILGLGSAEVRLWNFTRVLDTGRG